VFAQRVELPEIGRRVELCEDRIEPAAQRRNRCVAEPCAQVADQGRVVDGANADAHAGLDAELLEQRLRTSDALEPLCGFARTEDERHAFAARREMQCVAAHGQIADVGECCVQTECAAHAHNAGIEVRLDGAAGVAERRLAARLTSHRDAFRRLGERPRDRAEARGGVRPYIP